MIADSDAGWVGGAISGGDELLLRDNVFTGGAAPVWSIDIDDLPAGGYLVHLYAPSNSGVPTGRLTVGGIPLPGLSGSASSTLERGTSWTSIAVIHAGGTLEIVGDATGVASNAGLAGLQLLPLPEPGMGSLLLPGVGGLVMLGRRKRSSTGARISVRSPAAQRP